MRLHLKIFILISFLGLWSSSISGQGISNSNVITGDNQILIRDLKKVDNNGFLAYGVYLGTLNTPDNNSADGVSDLYLARYDEDFNLIWLKEIEGAGLTVANEMVIIDEEILVLGQFSTSCSFNNGQKTLYTNGTDKDVFIAKYALNGDFKWAKSIAFNSANQFGMTMDADINNNVIVGGYYQDSITFEGEKFISPYGMYFAKFDSAANFIWAKNIITNKKQTKLQTISAFNDGYYINGNFQGTATFDIKEISNAGNFTDVFLYKTDFDGNGVWIRQTYGDYSVSTGTITDDEYGNIYYTGYYSGSQLEMDANSSSKYSTVLKSNGSQEIFVLKYNKGGNIVWAKSYGTSGAEWARDLKYQNDFLYITGYLSDTLVFGNDTLFTNLSGDYDPFLGLIDREGNTLKAINIVDSDDGNDSGMEISSDSESNAYWGGYFKSSTLFIGDSTFNNSTGKEHVFFAKYTPPYVAVFTKKQNVSCNGQTDGKLIVTPYFGVAPYTYAWNHNGSLTDSTASGLAPGTYTVTVTDAVDSTAVVSYDLTEPGVITFNPVITDVVTCSYSEEGAIDVSTAGGNGGYQYQWLATEGGCGVTLHAEDQAGLTIGTYNVTVTDSKGCIGDTTMHITGPDPITFGGSVVTDSSGIGPGAIDLVYTGGFGDPASFTFDWQGPSGITTHSEDTSNLSPGNYSVTVTDVHVCQFDTLFNVANLDTFYIYIAKYKNACFGTINGSATVEFHSPDNHTAVTYQWDANAGSQTTAQATNLAPGRYYHVMVTDTENSPNTVLVDSVYIDELAYTFGGSLSGTSTLNCYGDNDGYIDLTITSPGTKPYTYNWSNGSTLQDLTDLGIGTYSVTVTDKYSCQFSVTNYTIYQPTLVSAVAEIVNSPSCNGDFDGEVTVDRSGGTAPYTYEWDDPGFQDTRNADGLDAGYYNVTVSDVNGCEATSGVNLTEPEAISISKVISNEVCNGAGEGAISLTVNGGTTPFSYYWSTTVGSGLVITDKNQSGLTAGKYYVTATDNNNCAYEDSAEIIEPTLLEITNEVKTNVNTCNGESAGSITVTATGGTGVLIYTLNPGAAQTNNTGAFTGLAAGNYSVDVADENLCSVTSSSFNITEPQALVLTEDDINNVTCNGTENGSILISVSGGTVATGYNYNWTTTDGAGISTGSQDQLALGAGTYNLTVTDDNACEVTSNFTLTEPNALVVTKTIYDISCNGGGDGVIVVSHTGGVLPCSYYWTTNDGSGLEPVDRNQGGLSAGTYHLEITDAVGCITNDTSEINDPPAIQIDSEAWTDATSQGASDGTITVVASGGTGALTYTLKPNNKSNQTGAFSVAPGNYTVEVIDENYCGPVASNTITVGYPDAIGDFSEVDLIKVYPNPTSNKLYLELDYKEKLNVEVLSLSGQIIMKEEIEPQGFLKKEIDLTGRSKGVYLVRIYNDQVSYKTKILLQ